MPLTQADKRRLGALARGRGEAGHALLEGAKSVGDALEAGVVLTDLRSGEGGLEDLFLELTATTQREAIS